MHRSKPWLVDFCLARDAKHLYPEFRYDRNLWYWGDREYISQISIRRAWEEPDLGVIGVFSTEEFGDLFQMGLAIRALGHFQAEQALLQNGEGEQKGGFNAIVAQDKSRVHSEGTTPLGAHS